MMLQRARSPMRSRACGYGRCMDRTTIAAQMRAASSPNDICNAINAARAWLADHPEDDDLRTALQHLMRAEREHFAVRR
jgi:hypothetical protein